VVAAAAPAPPQAQAAAPPVDLAALAAAQAGCADCARAATSQALRVITVTVGDSEMLVDTSSGVLRPVVPTAFRRQIFNAIHGLAHPGIRASRRLIGSRYVWPNLARDVAEWCRQCTVHAARRRRSRDSPPPMCSQFLLPCNAFHMCMWIWSGRYQL
jgi:hypothetical protein